MDQHRRWRHAPSTPRRCFSFLARPALSPAASTATRARAPCKLLAPRPSRRRSGWPCAPRRRALRRTSGCAHRDAIPCDGRSSQRLVGGSPRSRAARPGASASAFSEEEEAAAAKAALRAADPLARVAATFGVALLGAARRTSGGREELGGPVARGRRRSSVRARRARWARASRSARRRARWPGPGRGRRRRPALGWVEGRSRRAGARRSGTGPPRSVALYATATAAPAPPTAGAASSAPSSSSAPPRRRASSSSPTSTDKARRVGRMQAGAAGGGPAARARDPDAAGAERPRPSGGGAAAAELKRRFAAAASSRGEYAVRGPDPVCRVAAAKGERDRRLRICVFSWAPCSPPRMEEAPSAEEPRLLTGSTAARKCDLRIGARRPSRRRVPDLLGLRAASGDWLSDLHIRRERRPQLWRA